MLVALLACRAPEEGRAPPESASLAVCPDASGKLVLGHPGAIDLMAAGFPEDDGITLVYDSFDPAFTSSGLQLVHLDGDLAVSGPDPLLLGAGAPLTASPSAAGDSLYFIEGDDLYSPISISRSEREGDSFAQPLPVTVPGAASLLSWPHFHALDDGRMTVALLDGLGRPKVSLSQDGLSFPEGTLLDSSPKALADVGSTADGALVATWQGGVMPMVSYFQVSLDDGQSFGTPLPVTDAVNVHDTAILRRLDGEVDLYYITGQEHGFSLFRRALASDGTLGPEERLSKARDGDLTKPSPVRWPGCGVLLATAEITERAPSGEPVEQQLVAFYLGGDAPR